MSSTPHDESASSRILSLALNGDIQAQFELAQHLQADNQFEVAAGWFKKAALQGHPEAALQCGLLYLNAAEPSQRTDALYWLQKSASAGNSEAEFQLSNAYESGLGVRIDPDESLRWLRMAANHGNVNAQKKLKGLTDFLDIFDTDQSKRKGSIA
jgi:TPR repeat protein